MYSNMSTNVINSVALLLFGAVRRQILTLLLLDPERSIHLRAIARMIEAPAGSTRRELEQLVVVGILTRTRIGNQIHHQANNSCEVHAELVLLVRKLSQLPYDALPSKTPQKLTAPSNDRYK